MVKNSLSHPYPRTGYPRKTIEALTAIEEAKFLNMYNFKRRRDWILCTLPILTGLRPSEVLSLRLTDVQMRGGVLRAIELRADQTKGAKPRWVPIPSSLADFLKIYIARDFSFDQIINGNPVLFPAKKTDRAISIHMYERIVKNAGLRLIGRKIHPHIFRHTFATNVSRKASIKIVSELLGHSSIWTTMIYQHPDRDDLREAVENSCRTAN